jgi:hypothetical protein
MTAFLALATFLFLLMAVATVPAYAGWISLWKFGAASRRPPRKLGWAAIGSFSAAIIFFVTFGLTAERPPSGSTANADKPPTAIAKPSAAPAPHTEAVAAPPPAKPAYCASPAAMRLVECGWTEESQRRQDAEDARAEADRDAMFRYLRQKIVSECEKPVSEMTLDEIEDCNSQGMRALRGR